MIGVIQLINKLRGRRFLRTDEELVAAFCSQLAVSMENLFHLEEVNHSKQQVGGKGGREKGGGGGGEGEGGAAEAGST